MPTLSVQDLWNMRGEGSLDSQPQHISDEEMLLRALRAMPGRPRIPTYTRQRLTTEFSNPPRHQNQRAVMGEEYPPCRSPLSDLKKMMLKDLTQEKHHRGRFLVLHSFCRPYRSSAVMAAMEDETGDVERLAVYHAKDTLEAKDILAKDCVVTIKEPYYMSAVDGRHMLRVDHPSDIVVLEDDHALYLSQWRKHVVGAAKTALSWKLEGNAAVAKKSYLEAVRCYTRGLACVSPDDIDLKRDLFRNRSGINLLLGRYDATITDAFCSLSDKHDDVSKALDAKAHLRRGRANYRLGDYASAQRCFEKLLQLIPSDDVGKQELQKTTMRIKEQNEGAYDFAEIIQEVRKTGFFTDRASYVSKTEVRQTVDRGRGLFATQDIATGDLILCEKAFMAAHPDKNDTRSSHAVIQQSNRDTHASVWRGSVQKVIDNPSLARDLLDLYAGGMYTNHDSAPVVDGQAVIDVFQVCNISRSNGFAYTLCRESEPYGNTARVAEEDRRSSGLWSRASYANHACLYNASRSFIGDMMILRATKHIPKGAEITIAYLMPEVIASDDQKKLVETWGFRCDCLLCRTKPETTVSCQALVEESIEFLTSHDIFRSLSVVRPRQIRQAESLAAALDREYSSALHLQLPCLGMPVVQLWLCQIYVLQRNSVQVKRTGSRFLQSRGYKVEAKHSGVTLDTEHGLPSVEVVNALIYLSEAHKGDENKVISHRLRELAKDMYTVLNGSLAGFDEMY